MQIRRMTTRITKKFR